MLLTGKAKEDFLKWYSKKNKIETNTQSKLFYLLRHLFSMPEIIKNDLIIDFFDTKTIFIQHWGFIHNVNGMVAGFDCSVNFKGKEHHFFEEFYETRKEAIEKAIKKANEIYNNLNTKQNEK